MAKTKKTKITTETIIIFKCAILFYSILLFYYIDDDFNIVYKKYIKNMRICLCVCKLFATQCNG